MPFARCRCAVNAFAQQYYPNVPFSASFHIPPVAPAAVTVPRAVVAPPAAPAPVPVR